MERREFLTAAGALALTGSTAKAEESFPVAITVQADKSLGDLKPIWRFFGADEPNYATMKDGKKLIAELGRLAAARRSTSAPTTC